MPNDTNKNKPVGIDLGKGRIGYRVRSDAIRAFLAANGEDADDERPVWIENEESGRAGWVCFGGRTTLPTIDRNAEWTGDIWGTQVFLMLDAGNILDWMPGMLMRNAEGDDIRIRGWRMTRNGKEYRCVISRAMVDIDMLKDVALEEMFVAGFLDSAITPNRARNHTPAEQETRQRAVKNIERVKSKMATKLQHRECC